MNELKVLHPATADWLTENGYTFEHEVKMPINGKADFIAQKNGQTYILECKVTASQISRTIAQLLDYQMQLGSGEMVLVIPETLQIKDIYLEHLKKAGVRIWRIKTEKYEKIELEETNKKQISIVDMILSDDFGITVAYIKKAMLNPDAFMNELLDFHKKNKTSSFSDIELAERLFKKAFYEKRNTIMLARIKILNVATYQKAIQSAYNKACEFDFATPEEFYELSPESYELFLDFVKSKIAINKKPLEQKDKIQILWEGHKEACRFMAIFMSDYGNYDAISENTNWRWENHPDSFTDAQSWWSWYSKTHKSFFDTIATDTPLLSD